MSTFKYFTKTKFPMLLVSAWKEPWGAILNTQWLMTFCWHCTTNKSLNGHQTLFLLKWWGLGTRLTSSDWAQLLSSPKILCQLLTQQSTKSLSAQLVQSSFINNSANLTIVGLGGCQLWILIWAMNIDLPWIWAMNISLQNSLPSWVSFSVETEWS